MNFYKEELDPVESPVTPEPVEVDVCDKIAELLVDGGEFSIECCSGEFNKAHHKFKADRIAGKLSITYRDGVLNASVRL
jgi:hypothetical protein